MKNIFLFPTDKPSRLHITSKLMLYPNGLMPKSQGLCKNQNIYITNDEEIKEGDWCIDVIHNTICKRNSDNYRKQYKKIILTTDQDLIKDGVQAIDDEFLEWFVKNPSCEFVELKQLFKDDFGFWVSYLDLLQNEPLREVESKYKIIIPKEDPKFEDSIENSVNIMSIANSMFGKKEEPKQETIDEAASRLLYSKYPFHPPQDSGYWKDMFLEGVKWLEQRMYSEYELKKILIKLRHEILLNGDVDLEKWFEQIKKKLNN